MKLPFAPKQLGQAIIFMGIQASGKTTFYNKLLAKHGYIHINLDTLHTRHQEKLILEQCISDKSSFVIDNTNPEISDRQRYIPNAKEKGYEIIGIFFQSKVRDCIERNEKRENKVPANAIPCTQNKLQFPRFDEGFDKLYFVQIADGGFKISNWEV